MITTKILRSHMLLREECTSDQYVCGQVCGEYKRLELQDKTVFDLGGNIGAFSVYSVLNKSKEVIAYEPDVNNFELLCKNTDKFPNIKRIHGAITHLDTDTISFYETTGKARDGFSIIPFNGRIEVIVPAYNLSTELEKYRPDVIKMDVEGAEYDLLLNTEIPDYVKELVVEIHFSKRVFRTIFPKIKEKFDSWNCVIEPKVTEKNFHTLGHWRR